MDFYSIETAPVRGQAGQLAASPDFINGYSRDIMINRGSSLLCGIQTLSCGLRESTRSLI